MKTQSSIPSPVLVIGSGIGGLSTAIILAKLGVEVTVLDTYTPLTIRDGANSPGGSAYGVLRSSSQMLGTPC